MSEPTDEEIRSAFAAVLPTRRAAGPTGEMGVGSEDLGPGRAYLAGTVDGGWAVPTWPRLAGGRDADAGEAARIARIRNEFAVPDLYIYLIGVAIAGPTLLRHGTDDQQARWLRPIADGSEIWCQMFSEPEAGSDLANVALRASRDGDEWRLDGQKVWVSRSMWARWGLILTRTDPDVPKHRGLTMFAVDMHAPGVDVRPLVQMNGDRHFSEVFLDQVRVPDSHRIGDVGGGWNVAMTVLANERAAGRQQAPPRLGGIPPWILELSERGVLEAPVRRDRAMRAYIVGRVAALTSARAHAAEANGPGPSGSGAKLDKVRAYKLQTELVKDSYGAAGMLADHRGHLDFLTSPSMSIRGGTDEIQHNIVGERVLGLPAEPRVDRDAPWSIVRRGVG